jgi:hypothetical protein
MPTPKHPEKRTDLRATPPGAGQSAPPRSGKGPSRGQSFRMPAAPELSDTRARARAPSGSAIDLAEELLRQMTIEEKGDAAFLRLSSGAVRHQGGEPQPARRPAKEWDRARFRARPDRAQDAGDARELGQRNPALPGHGDAAQDPRDLPQRGHEWRGGAPVHGVPHLNRARGDVGPRGDRSDGRHHPAPDAGGGHAPGAGTGHGRGPRCPLGQGE